MRTPLPNGRFHLPLENSYSSEHHTNPWSQEQWQKGRGCEREKDLGREEYRDHTHHPKHPQNHTWSNNRANTRGGRSPLHSPSRSPEKDKKNRKVKKSESESGIAKLFKTLRKEGGLGKKATDREARGRHRSPERRKGTKTRRGSLDRSPTCKHGSSPDRRRAKSMDRRADRTQRDYSPEQVSRGPNHTFNRQMGTPERHFQPQQKWQPQTPSRSYQEEGYLTSTPERPNNGLKNGPFPSSEQEERFWSNGTLHRRYRRESDSSSNSSFLEEAAAPRLKDYYNAMKANSTISIPQSKRRLYKENQADLSIWARETPNHKHSPSRTVDSITLVIKRPNEVTDWLFEWMVNGVTDSPIGRVLNWLIDRTVDLFSVCTFYPRTRTFCGPATNTATKQSSVYFIPFVCLFVCFFYISTVLCWPESEVLCKSVSDQSREHVSLPAPVNFRFISEVIFLILNIFLTLCPIYFS